MNTDNMNTKLDNLQISEKNFVNELTGYCSSIIQDPPIKFPYECDSFQNHAFVCISNDENILVTVPTGSGKTTIAEYAIAYTIQKGKNVVYTSPIKSLSNEKYNDFSKKFSKYPNISIGILTGDNKINPEGNCLIMTAEILRNALYKLKYKNNFDTPDKYNINKNFIDDIGCVIMDEVHFINDPNRGKIWEETIVLLNRNIQLVLLSATINHAKEFAQWIGSIKQKKVNLISTTYRAVPLSHYIYTNGNLYQIFENDKYFHSNYALAHKEYMDVQKIRQQKHKSDINFNLVNEILKYLKKNNMLQAIIFSFSKRKCEYYAQSISENFVDESEIKEINSIFNKYMHKYEKQYEQIEQYQIIKNLIEKGVAFHHSGLLPILKEIIEIIFHQGLIKVLFATETFAVGVNMPTRTVIFTELEKKTCEGRRILNTAEYKQMSGRAGRRGIDTTGNVIILPIYNFPDDDLLRTLLMGSLPHIESKFQIDYHFILKVVQSESTNLTSFLNDSLMMTECKRIITANKNELNKIEKELNNFNFAIVPKLNLDKVKRLYELENNITLYGMKVKISKSEIKKRNSLKSEINKDKKLNDLYKLYCDYYKTKLKYDEIKQNINEWESYYKNTLDLISKFLKKIGYITEDNLICKKGIIAAQINECNAIILTEMITSGFFKGLSAEEIVGILAIFIEETKTEDKTIQITPKLMDHINNINSMINFLISIEEELGILDNEKYWSISSDFVDLAFSWACGEPLKTNEEFYIGNFIRNMIKINNIAKDLIHLFQIDGDNEIVPTLEKIEPLIMRDFVTVNSLYLTKL